MRVSFGVLIGVVGVAVTLVAGGVVMARPVPAFGGLDRLRLARSRLTGSAGGLGAFALLFGGGVLAVTVVGAVFGFAVAALEHPVDWWAFHLADRLRTPGWTRLMNVVTQLGNIPPTRVTGVVFAVLLTFVAPRRWVPAVLILGVIVVEKYQQTLLATIVDRGHPPTTLGTYPSGGCARVICVYGTILFLVLGIARAGRRTRVLAWTLLCAAAFAEGYSRWYLNKHWVTDVVGGWVYGGLLLAVVVFAGRVLMNRNPGGNNAVSMDAELLRGR